MDSKENKIYEFKGKKVIAVPEKDIFSCNGCEFHGEKKPFCEMATETSAGNEQKLNAMPDCLDEEIIFQLAPDEQ